MTFKVQNIAKDERCFRDPNTGIWIVLKPKESVEVKKRPRVDPGIFRVEEPKEETRKSKKEPSEDDEE